MLSELTYSLNTAPLASTALERKQALAKQFAEILHFTLLFDELKVCREQKLRLWRFQTSLEGFSALVSR